MVVDFKMQPFSVEHEVKVDYPNEYATSPLR